MVEPAPPTAQAPPKPRLLAALPIAIAGAASIAYGLTFGFTYGVNNQVAYMLASLRLLDPTILRDDWLAAHTLNYHPAFAYLGWLLLAIGGRGGWGIGVATVVAAAAGAFALYFVARRLFPAELSLPAFLLLLVLMLASGTREMAMSYAFDPIFQPSMVASALLVASIPPFLAGRWLLSGVLLGLGSLFHANFLVLGVATFGLAHLMLGKGEGKDAWRERMPRHLGPSIVVGLLLAPVILKGVGGADAARGQEILFEIRSPHHYRPRGYLADFFPFLAWQMLGLGLGGWVFRVKEGRGRRFAALVLALLAVVWGGTVAAVVFESRRATQLFVWRFAPYVDLLLQLVIVGSVLRWLLTPRAPLRMPPASVAATAAGLAGLLVSLVTRDPPVVTWIEWMVLLAVVGLGVRAALHYAPDVVKRIPSWGPRAACVAAGALAAFVFVNVVREPLSTVSRRSNLVTGMPGAETDLYAWLREHTPKDATILSPPGLERFRIASERAIVVDWKSSTYAPAELVEWYRRLEDVSGRKGFRSRDEVVSGYDAMDRGRLAALRDKYHLTYAVVGRGREAALGYPTAYANGPFVVLDLTTH
jgi:hypothetical protein